MLRARVIRPQLVTLAAETLLKRRLLQGYFPTNVLKFLKTTYLVEHLQMASSYASSERLPEGVL